MGRSCCAPMRAPRVRSRHSARMAHGRRLLVDGVKRGSNRARRSVGQARLQNTAEADHVAQRFTQPAQRARFFVASQPRSRSLLQGAGGRSTQPSFADRDRRNHASDGGTGHRSSTAHRLPGRLIAIASLFGESRTGANRTIAVRCLSRRGRILATDAVTVDRALAARSGAAAARATAARACLARATVARTTAARARVACATVARTAAARATVARACVACARRSARASARSGRARRTGAAGGARAARAAPDRRSAAARETGAPACCQQQGTERQRSKFRDSAVFHGLHEG